MKFFNVMLILLVAVSISCKEEKKKETTKTDTKQSTAEVKHYYCANNCENSGGDSAGNCPTCSTPYIHNQAFHNKDFLKSGPLNVPQNNQNTNNTNNSNTPSPAQNKFGVFHYICDNGCQGGLGSGGKCKTCGSDLKHNTAYHN